MKGITCFLMILICPFLLAQSSIEKESFRDVLYKVTKNQDSLKLDIFLPENSSAKPFPVLMVIHGGAWVEGDKSLDSIYYMQKLREEALRNDFAIVSINYSLLGKEVHFPAPVVDCRDAVRWIKSNAETYHFDTENIGLWGGSAGAHLALLVGYTDDSIWAKEEDLNQYSAEVNYVVDNFGPSDLNKLLKTDAGFFTVFFFKTFLPGLYDIRNKLILAMTGTSLEDDENAVKETLKKFSPLSYIQSKNVPTLIFHGTRDKIVPLKESKTLHKSLDEIKAENEFIKVKKGDHGFNEISNEEIDEIVRQTIEFMKEHLK